MFANHFMAVTIVVINRSVIFLMVLKSVSFGSVGRRITIIMFFVITPGVLIPSAAVVRRFPAFVAPVCLQMKYLDLCCLIFAVNLA